MTQTSAASLPEITTPVPPDSAIYRRYRWELFASTWLSYAGFYITRKVFGIVKGPIKETLGINDLLLSNIFTAYLITYMLGQFATAFLSRRFTNRQLLLAGMSVSVACNVAMAAWIPLGHRAYPLLLGAMAVHGFAQATGWPCNIGLMANWTRHSERGSVMAVWATCYQLGAVGAKALASFLLGWLGLVWPFYGSSVALGIVVVVFFFGARERPEDHGLPPPEEEPSPSAESETTRSGGTGTGFGLIIALGLTYFGMKFLRYALDSWAPLILSEQFHLSASTAGYYSTVFDWLGFGGVLAGGWASDRWFRSQRLPVIAWMSVGCLVATIGLKLGIGSLSVTVAMIGLIGFMEMGPDALLSGAAAMDTGSRRRAAMAAGIINGLGSAGPIVQEPAIGWLKTSYGVNAVFLLLVGIGALSAVATSLLWFGARRMGLRL